MKIKIEKALIDSFSKDLIEVYKTQGEQAFRNTAKFLHLTDDDIEQTLKELKGGKKQWKMKV